jgi:hypothetical protein
MSLLSTLRPAELFATSFDSVGSETISERNSAGLYGQGILTFT